MGILRRSRHATAILVTGLVVAACTTPATTGPTGAAQPASQAATASVATHPSTSPTATAPPVHVIPTEYTTPLLATQTDGREIVWSTGLNAAAGAAPDLWRYLPGHSKPEIVYSNPYRDSTLEVVAVDQGRYAFVEANEARYGSNGYRIWFVRSFGAAATVVDQGDWQAGEPGFPLPRLTVRGDRLVWMTFHHVAGSLQSELLEYRPSTGKTEVLASAPSTTREFWDPSLDVDGHRLVYATVDPTGASWAFHVWFRDLGSSGAAIRLDPYGLATGPVISGSAVLWKEVHANVFNRGVLDLGVLPAVNGQPLRAHQLLGLGEVSEPSAGRRFATAWQDAGGLEVVDLGTGQVLPLIPPPDDGSTIVRPQIAGDLIAFVYGYLDVKSLELAWMDLSEYP